MAKGPVFSIAIGIGETYCRLVYCRIHDFHERNNTMTSLQWFNSIKQRHDTKTPNTLLLNPDKSFHSFGEEAQINYANITMDEKEDQSTYYYFRNLHDLKNISRRTKIQDQTGKMIPVFDVFLHLIRSMKEECSRLDISEFLDLRMFTVTFPTRWGNNAKSCIREAAEKVGIPRDDLIVVQEPVVAALSYYSSKSDQMDSFYKAVMSGASYIVLDLGGRYGNISYHQHNGFLRKLLQTEGRLLGRKSVSDEFLKFLGQVYGEKPLLQLKEERPDVYETMIDAFEDKLHVCSAEGQGKLNFTIPLAIRNKILDECRFAGSVNATADKLRISKVHVRQWFEKTLAAIEIGLERILHYYRSERAEYILMVGEFSECEYVQSSIRKRFPQTKVIVPHQPHVAAIRGTANFIFISGTMNSKARCTYGVQHWPKFEKSIHPLDKLVVIDGVIRCKDVFFKFIERGEQIPVYQRISHVCTLLSSSSDTVECTVYASCHPDPKFTDEEGCIVLGVLQTPFTVDGDVAKVEIKQTLIFGETCITLQANNMMTGQVCETQMEYM